MKKITKDTMLRLRIYRCVKTQFLDGDGSDRSQPGSSGECPTAQLPLPSILPNTSNPPSGRGCGNNKTPHLWQ
jgi:hypothetical protein